MTTPVGPSTPPSYPSFGGNEKPNIGMTQNEFEGTADGLIGNAAYTGSSSPTNSDSTVNNDSSSKTQKQKETDYEFKQLDDTAKKDRQQTKAEEKQNKQNELSGG